MALLLHDLVPQVNKRVLIPYLCMIAYWIMGSVMFYYMEAYVPQYEDFRSPNLENCITTPFSAIFFSFAACTTIGFGVVYPCTLPGRIIAVFYILFGVPQLLIVLADIGTHLCGCMIWLYKATRVIRRWWRRRPRKRKVTVVEESNPWGDFDPYIDPMWLERMEQMENGGKKKKKNRKKTVIVYAESEDEEDEILTKQLDEVDIPIWIGALLTLISFLACAGFYCLAEGQGFADAFYSSCLTFLAGDYFVTNFTVAVPCYAIVLVGFSMLSTTIRIVQNNIENFMKRVQRDLDDKIKELQDQVEAGELDPAMLEQMTRDVIRNAASKAGMGGSLIAKMMSPQNQKSMVEHAQATVTQVALDQRIQAEQSRVDWPVASVQCELLTDPSPPPSPQARPPSPLPPSPVLLTPQRSLCEEPKKSVVKIFIDREVQWEEVEEVPEVFYEDKEMQTDFDYDNFLKQFFESTMKISQESESLSVPVEVDSESQPRQSPTRRISKLVDEETIKKGSLQFMRAKILCTWFVEPCPRRSVMGIRLAISRQPHIVSVRSMALRDRDNRESNIGWIKKNPSFLINN